MIALIVLLLSFLLTAILTPLFKTILVRFDIVDRPDSHRKLHVSPVPRAGGIPIAVSFGLSSLILAVLPLPSQAGIASGLHSVWRLLPAAGLIFATGLIDDVVGLTPWRKLLGQIAAAGVAFYAGVRIIAVQGHPMELWLSLPLTILWLVACTNAINLLDGLDGLAAGVGMFAAVTAMLVGWLNTNGALVFATAPLVGSLLAFLPFNFSRASIFLGDSGSLFLGFLLGCYGVLWSSQSTTLSGMIAPAMLLAIPLLDMSFAVLRRLLSYRPVFQGDRGHIHHKLLDRGYSPRRVVLTLYGISGFAAALSLLQSMADKQYKAFVVVVFCAALSAGIWYALHHLGYIEIGLAGQMLLRGELTRANLKAALLLRELQTCLNAASSIDECWLAIVNASRQLGFASVTLHSLRATFQTEFDSGGSQDRWLISVPLSEADCLILGHNFERKASSALPTRLFAQLRDIVGSRIRGLQPVGWTPAETWLHAAND